MFDYTFYTENSSEKFKEACDIIERAFPKANKHRLLVDVDGTTIQTYTQAGKDIDVYDDYDVGAVYIRSEIDINKNTFRETP